MPTKATLPDGRVIEFGADIPLAEAARRVREEMEKLSVQAPTTATPGFQQYREAAAELMGLPGRYLEKIATGAEELPPVSPLAGTITDLFLPSTPGELATLGGMGTAARLGARTGQRLARFTGRAMERSGGIPQAIATVGKPIVEPGARFVGGTAAVGGLGGTAAGALGEDPWEGAQKGVLYGAGGQAAEGLMGLLARPFQPHPRMIGQPRPPVVERPGMIEGAGRVRQARMGALESRMGRMEEGAQAAQKTVQDYTKARQRRILGEVEKYGPQSIAEERARLKAVSQAVKDAQEEYAALGKQMDDAKKAAQAEKIRRLEEQARKELMDFTGEVFQKPTQTFDELHGLLAREEGRKLAGQDYREGLEAISEAMPTINVPIQSVNEAGESVLVSMPARAREAFRMLSKYGELRFKNEGTGEVAANAKRMYIEIRDAIRQQLPPEELEIFNQVQRQYAQRMGLREVIYVRPNILTGNQIDVNLMQKTLLNAQLIPKFEKRLGEGEFTDLRGIFQAGTGLGPGLQ